MVHLAIGSVVAGIVVLSLLCFTASPASLGFIGVSLAGIELLFLSSEDECGTAVSTL